MLNSNYILIFFSVESFENLIGVATANEQTPGFKDFGKYVARPK
jgi:hypothetical protein